MWVEIENDYRLRNGTIVTYQAEGEVIFDETYTVVENLSLSFATDATEDFKRAAEALSIAAEAIANDAAERLIERARELQLEAS